VANAVLGPDHVGSRFPNRFGLFDTLGNLSEWCDFTQGTPQIHPEGELRPAQPFWQMRPVRGGAYFSRFEYCRVDYRFSQPFNIIHPNYGFRIARSLPDDAPSQPRSDPRN
jgi:formylglycine-generating enzyme required for sulfatase activity